MDYDRPEWKEGLRRLQEAQTEIVKLRQRLARYEPQAESSDDGYGMQVVAWYYEIAGEMGLSFAPDSNPYKPWVPLYAEGGKARLESLCAAVDRLQRDCAEAYQVIGAGMFLDPAEYTQADVERAMDNLSAAANGDPRPHDDLLPWPQQSGDEQ
jgi:hypothetical protein